MKDRRVLLFSDTHHSISEDGFPSLITTRTSDGFLDGVQKFNPQREYLAMEYTHVFNPDDAQNRLVAQLDLHRWYRIVYTHPGHQSYLEDSSKTWHQIAFMQGIFIAEQTSNSLFLEQVYVQFTSSISTNLTNKRILISPVPGMQILNDQMSHVVFEVPMNYAGNF